MNLRDIGEVAGFALHGIRPSKIGYVKGAASVHSSNGQVNRLTAQSLVDFYKTENVKKKTAFYVAKALLEQDNWTPETEDLLKRAAIDSMPEIFEAIKKYTHPGNTKVAAMKGVALRAGAVASSIPKSIIAAILLTSAAAGAGGWALNREIGVGSEEEQRLKTQIDQYVNKQLQHEGKAYTRGIHV